MKLQKLQIDAFRGASKPITIEFDTDKRITMIFGENGNGKSTITDSLVCLCTEDHGSLDDKSSRDKSSFYASIARKPEDVKVILSTTTGNFQASLSGKDFTKNPATGLPVVRHLRRSQLTKFIEAQPSKRYEELNSFIDVDNIFKCEGNLRNLIREIENEQQIALRVLEDNSNILEQAWKKEGSPLSSWEEWAKQESEKDIAEEKTKHKTLQDIADKWKSIVEANAKLKTDKSELQVAVAAKEAAEEKMKKAQEENEGANADLLSLLESAKKFIAGKTDINSCPVCDNSIERDGIVSSLTSKIDSMNVFKALVLAVKSTRETTQSKQNVLTATVNSLMKKIEGIESVFSKLSEDPYPALVEKLAFIKTEDEIDKKLSAFETVYTEVDQEITKLAEQATRIKTAIDQHQLIESQYKAILNARSKSAKTQEILEAARKSLEIVETARKDFVQGELDSISTEVDALYQKLHPNESLGGISLTLKKDAQKSLELNADFHSKKGITPQAAYSESHLDTLGICVFLALSKKYGSSNSILILDDVVMSVDETHLDRFIDVLHDEADGFGHIIITTHYRPWKDRYRNSRAPAGKVHFVELGGWTLPNGIKIRNSKLAIDELRHALGDTTSFDRQGISSKAGIILENILDFLTVKFESRLPRKPKNDYMLGELLGSFNSKLMGVLKVELMDKDASTGKYSTTSIAKAIELKEILNKIKQLAAVRNQVGAHYNFDGSLVSDTDVEEFGKLTLELAELIICPDSGNFPDKNKSGSYWETRSGSIRLYPLKEPQ